MAAAGNGPTGVRRGVPVVNESAAASAGGSSRRRWARWLVPVAVTGALVGGPGAAALLPAGAAASLPPLTAAQLLEKIQTAKVDGFSGDVTASTDLGLPKLPAGLAGGASALSLLTGDHSVRVWQSGQDQSRVALLDTFAETEVVLSGSDVWTYDSTKNAVTHVRLPDRAAPNAKSAPADGSPAEGSPFGGAEALTPADAAAKVLAAIDPTTQVTVGEAATVAGRSTYELRVSPRSTSSLVDTVVLTKRFRGGQLAVVDLDLVVPAGSVFGFLGPNVSGKTTTIRMLLGLASPSAGVARLFGETMPGAGRRVLPRVGALVEGPACYPFLSGRDNLRRLDAADRTRDARREARIETALERVGLTAAGGKRYRAYSLGMRQRLGLAAALLRPRELLVLDEPTNGLDPQGTREVRALIRSLAADGTTVFLSSHLLAEVEQVRGQKDGGA